jgi:hypothetical protein
MALGERRDHPHRWRLWVSVVTQLYLCAACDTVVARESTRRPAAQIVAVDGPWSTSRGGAPAQASLVAA